MKLRMDFIALTLLATQTVSAADIDAVWTQAAELRVSYTEHVFNAGQLPASLEEFGYDESYADISIEHLDVEPTSGALMIGLPPSFGVNHWIALVPQLASDFTVDWVCRSTLPASSLGSTGEQWCHTVAHEDLTLLNPQQLFQPIWNLATSIRLNYAEFYATTGSLPETLDDLSLNESELQTSRISHLWVDSRSGTIMIALPAPLGLNQWLAFRPKLSRYGVRSWRCESTLSAWQLPRRCMANASWFELTR